jgi:hypothetical protein
MRLFLSPSCFPPLTRRLTAAVCLAAVLLCPACAGDGHKAVYPVRGRVLVDGKPAARALVSFHPVGDGGRDAVHPTGYVDADGRFTLTTYVTGDGAPTGEYRVSVVWLLPTPRGSDGDDGPAWNYLPERYARADATPLKAVVARGGAELPPFELSAK